MEFTDKQMRCIAQAATNHASAIFVSRYDKHDWGSDDMQRLVEHSLNLAATIEICAAKYFSGSGFKVVANRKPTPPEKGA
jgi:hypothetical protein